MQGHHAQDVKERKLTRTIPLNHAQHCGDLTYFHCGDVVTRAVAKHLKKKSMYLYVLQQ